MTRRFSRLLALALSVFPAAALAQESPTDGEPKVEGEVAAPPSSADGEPAEGDEEKEDDGLPLSMTLSLSNAVGSGWLSPGYTMQPSFSQSVTPVLAYKLPEVSWLPKMSLSAKMDVGIDWLGNYQTTVYERIPRLSDAFANLSFPQLYKEDFTGISVSGSLVGRAPLSLNSRRWNTLGALGLGGSVAWSTEHLDDMLPEWLGDLSLSWAPSASAVAHLYPNASLPCDAAPMDDGVLRVGNAAENLERIPLVVGRQGEVLPDGSCIVGGRRIIGNFSHTTSLGWSYGKHSVSASLGLLYALLAPLNDTPGLSSPYASSQNWTEKSTGSLSYSYTVPMESFDLPFTPDVSLSAGISSMQPTYDASGRYLLFPWWDFVTPANSYSSAFVGIDVGI